MINNTSDNILLSVCLVTYNHDFFIKKVLDSVISQETDFRFELVIGEDCSTDKTRSICEEYQHLYPNIVNLLPPTRNLGLKENFLRTFSVCRGKYIAYLEGDDYWISNKKIQKQVDLLETYSGISLVHTNCHIWDTNNDLIIKSVIPTEGICIREQQYGLSSIIAEFEGNFRGIKTSSCVYRKDTLETILKEDEYAFRCEEFPMQDFQLFLEMSMKGKFAFIPEPMTMIGLHDSLSAAKNEKNRISYNLGFYRAGIYYIKKYQLPKRTIQIWVRRQLNYMFNIGFKNKDKKLVENVKRLADSVNYTIPLTQRLLYLGTKSTFFRLLLYPFWKLLTIYRNQN